jgi:two-component system LytT family response regulator
LKARILIVDDEPLARDRIREMLRGDDEVQFIKEARNGREAIEAIIEHAPDLVFLDIQMPDMDGFEVLQRIEADHIPFVIFVTAYDQYALRAFEVHALDYLMKPFDRERFARAWRHAKDQLRNPSDGRRVGQIMAMLEEIKAGTRYVERFPIKSSEKILFVRSEDVDAIEAEGNYVRLKVAGCSYMLRETINSIESQVDPHTFVRIHRSTIVNMNRVKELQAWARGEYRVVLENGSYYTLSRGYREHFDEFIRKR